MQGPGQLCQVQSEAELQPMRGTGIKFAQVCNTPAKDPFDRAKRFRQGIKILIQYQARGSILDLRAKY